MDPIQAEIDKLNRRIEYESLKPEAEIDERLVCFLKAERQLLFDRQDRLFLQMRKIQDIQIDTRVADLPAASDILSGEFDESEVLQELQTHVSDYAPRLQAMLNNEEIDRISRVIRMDKIYQCAVSLKYIATMKRQIAQLAVANQLRGRASHKYNNVDIRVEGLGSNSNSRVSYLRQLVEDTAMFPGRDIAIFLRQLSSTLSAHDHMQITVKRQCFDDFQLFLQPGWKSIRPLHVHRSWSGDDFDADSENASYWSGV